MWGAKNEPTGGAPSWRKHKTRKELTLGTLLSVIRTKNLMNASYSVHGRKETIKSWSCVHAHFFFWKISRVYQNQPETNIFNSSSSQRIKSRSLVFCKLFIWIHTIVSHPYFMRSSNIIVLQNNTLFGFRNVKMYFSSSKNQARTTLYTVRVPRQ